MDLDMLTSIPADNIARIHILSGIDGTTYYGTNTVTGVIMIFTKDGAEQAER